MTKLRTLVLSTLAVSLALLLGGCKLSLLNPAGIIAEDELRLLVETVSLMLVVVIPVMILTVVIAWRYRAKNTKAQFKPNWSHSVGIEIVCWTVPCIIIALLAAMTWISTHKLDPYKSIATKNEKTLIIQVVALDWRWLFIYPEQKIATINYIRIPVNVPVRFEITADAPMNSIEIPRLAGQIYAMGGMRTNLYFNALKLGTYKGFSTNYSGDGFAEMTFNVDAVEPGNFKKWVAKTKRSPKKLTWKYYNDQVVRPHINSPPSAWSGVENKFFQRIIQKFTNPKYKKMIEAQQLRHKRLIADIQHKQF